MSCEHKKAYMFHDNAPSYCPDCGKYIDGGEVVVTEDKEPKTWDKLKQKLTSEIIKKIVELAEGFICLKSDSSDIEYISAPNGFRYSFEELLHEKAILVFSTLLHRAVEGWNNSNSKCISIDWECVRQYSVGEYLFTDYLPCHLTACEMAMLDCLCKVLK